MPEEITFESLSEDIQKALELLKKVRERAVEGVGGHKISSCPIAKGYGVITSALWPDICGDNLARLEDAGWNETIYSSFLRWYDCLLAGWEDRLAITAARENFLKEFLSQND